MASSKKLTQQQAMEDLAKRKHHVAQSTAASMVKKYKTFRTKLASASKNGGALPATVPDLPTFVTYNKKAIQGLLKKPGCAGIRIYPAINNENTLTFVLVAIDEAGENIFDAAAETAGNAMAKPGGGVVDEGQTSPPYPAPAF